MCQDVDRDSKGISKLPLIHQFLPYKTAVFELVQRSRYYPWMSARCRGKMGETLMKRCSVLFLLLINPCQVFCGSQKWFLYSAHLKSLWQLRQCWLIAVIEPNFANCQQVTKMCVWLCQELKESQSSCVRLVLVYQELSIFILLTQISSSFLQI